MVGSNERDHVYIQTLDKLEVLEEAILELLVLNKDLFKYLKFSDSDPLSHSITDNDILDDLTVEFDSNGELNPGCRVFFEPFIDSALTSHTAMLRIYPCEIDPEDIYVGDLFLQVDVIVHQSISKIKDGRRRNRILAEVLRALNGKSVGLVQHLRLIDKPVLLQQFKGDYWGWSLLLRCGVAGG